jgi:hypothetical protein
MMLVGKQEGKKTLGRTRRRQVDNDKMDLRETNWGGMEWNKLTWDTEWLKALENASMKLWLP